MILAAAALAATLAPAQHQVRPPQTDQTEPVQRGARLTVENFAGDVVIHTWDKDAVHVQARHQPRTRVAVRHSASGLAISASGPAGSVDYDIIAPAWMPIKITGTYVFVTVDGAQNEISAESVRGDIVIKGGSAFVTAKTVEGEITVEGARGKINVSSVNQGIKVGDSSGDITADSVNGQIAMTKMNAKSVAASTINGNISYEGALADGGRYEMTSHNGDIDFIVPESANATVAVRTYNGSVSSNLPLKGGNPREADRGKRVTLTLGNGSADVELESFGGTIRLRRLEGARRRNP
jgi:putative adhesin